jgi:hypothetical protein
MKFVNFISTNTEEISIELEFKIHGGEIYYHIFSPWAPMG